jgi:hypothetical protein
VQLVAALVFVPAVAVRGEIPFSEDEFEDRLQGGDAGGDYYDVRFDAKMVSMVRGGSWGGETYLVQRTRSAVPSRKCQ